MPHPFTYYRILSDAGWTFLFGPAGACRVIVAHYDPEDVSDPVGFPTLEDTRREAVAEAREARKIDGEWDVRVLDCVAWWRVERAAAGVTVH